ncbi:hypothetical protein DUT91_15220 [Phyllobacterium salinisoli]|uniref:EexN family lipoprotein n=1 Tax=Phyllobacterium salinisoli TaxID=1899321 RepID=A0A368K0D1_9HYPH|nr:EexN family lipoprotein [Phyllobacterium salinisoli]RCS22847.1 hypothetical protein DUT91_15220 [Phyllobacterium salinisoli]
MKRSFLRLTIFGLTACSQQAERTYSVDELTADESLLAGIIAKCRNNPGEVRNAPNCRNAEAADGKLRLQRMLDSLRG